VGASLRNINPGEQVARGLETVCPNPLYVVEGFSMPDIYRKMPRLPPPNFVSWGNLCDSLFSSKFAFSHGAGRAYFYEYKDALLFLLSWC